MGIFSGNCPVPDGANDYGQKGTSHKPMLYVALVCTMLTLVISLSLIVLHLRRYRTPKEQRQIIRIIFCPCAFAMISLGEIYNYKAAQYIDPLGEIYESFAICALFLLYLQFAAPGATFNEEMFEMVRAAEEGQTTKFDWPRITWILIFQYPITELVAVIILEATEAANDYCATSMSPKYGHIWVEIIRSFGLALAVGSILAYYKKMKSRMKARRGLAKLVSFKVIVFLHFIQTWVFNILLDHKVIKPSKATSYGDLLYGIPNLLTCCEMVICSGAFWYSYSSAEYSSKAKPSSAPLPIYKAVIDAMNPLELFAGIVRAFKLALHMQESGGFAEWSAAKAEAKAAKNGGRGRYQNTDGMEPISYPQDMHGRYAPNTGYYHMEDTQPLYQPPSTSPPGYSDPSKGHLTADARSGRSPSQGSRERY